MLSIRINGHLACLKENTSFDFIAENRMFTGSDSYTLSITFPLKGCLPNMEIFGNICRKDVEKNKVIFDCDIRDGAFFKSGTIVITEVSDIEVKTQFLEGRSEQNFDDSFDTIFLNEMSLGYPAKISPSENTIPNTWLPYPTNKWVPLPWVNNSSGNIQNEVSTNKSGAYSWAAPYNLSFQPYLLHIIKEICRTIGYSCDLSEIEESEYKFLLVCNTLPHTWNTNNFAAALPHWSLTEFFEQLELILYGEFSINHKAKHISFAFTSNLTERIPPIKLDKVINEYTAEVSREDSCDYLGVKNLAYAENDNRFWSFRSCEWYIREHKNEAVVYDRLADLLNFAKSLKLSGYEEYTSPTGGARGVYSRGYANNSDGHKLFYAKDVDTFFIMFCYDAVLLKTTTVREQEYHWYQYYNRLEPINQFGQIWTDKEAETVEMKIVPAWIDDTDEEHGRCLFLECGEMGSAEQWTDETEEGSLSGGFASNSGATGFGGARTGTANYSDDTDYDSGELAQSKAGKAIARGQQNKADAYFDCIYMAFWDGKIRWQGKQPCPVVDNVMTDNDFNFMDGNYSLRLNHVSPQINRAAMMRIDGKKKYNFSFLADEIPDPRAVFYINGGRYLCEKITASFSEKGMSKKLKGMFYRLLDSE